MFLEGNLCHTEIAKDLICGIIRDYDYHGFAQECHESRALNFMVQGDK